MPTVSPNQKKFCMALLVALAVFAVFLLWPHDDSRRGFGPLIDAQISESPKDTQTALQKADATVRESLRLPERASPDRYFTIGGAPLEWSIHHNSPPDRDGYIYMNHPLLNNTPLWEFAISTRTSLRGVTRDDLRCEFYGMGDPRGSQTFGTNWGGHTILVPEGQVFFARLMTNRTVVYVIHLLRQSGSSDWGTMRIQYFPVTNQPPNPA